MMISTKNIRSPIQTSSYDTDWVLSLSPCYTEQLKQEQKWFDRKYIKVKLRETSYRGQDLILLNKEKTQRWKYQ